jgi:Cd(II)/Pb(II)-responsive transcriptional regulator
VQEQLAGSGAGDGRCRRTRSARAALDVIFVICVVVRVTVIVPVRVTVVVPVRVTVVVPVRVIVVVPVLCMDVGVLGMAHVELLLVHGYWNVCSSSRVKSLHCPSKSPELPVKIGELSTASSTPIETIRYYEREGLLPTPARSQGNFRVYEGHHLERLQFIRYCRSLDMSLDEVRVLLRFKDAPGPDCGDVNALLDEHIGHVSRRIKELRALEKQLQELRRRCGEARAVDQCGILNGLSEAAQEAPSATKEHSHLRSLHRH